MKETLIIRIINKIMNTVFRQQTFLHGINFNKILKKGKENTNCISGRI